MNRGRRHRADGRTRWFSSLTSPGSLDLSLGPAVVEGGFSTRTNRTVRLFVIGCISITHAVMALVTGDEIWWVMVAISVVHAALMVPRRSLAERLSPLSRTSVDYAVVFVSTLILGDPFMSVVRAPLALPAIFIFVNGARQLAGFGIAAACVGLSYGAWAIGVIDNDIGADAMRLYAFMGGLTLVAVVAIHALSLGAALGRRDERLSSAKADRATALEVSEQRAHQIQTMLDEAPMGLVVQAADASFLYANSLAVDLLGLSADHLRERGAADAFDRDEWRRVAKKIRPAMESHQPYQLEYALRRKDGGVRWVRHHGHALPLETEVGYISTLQDITAERMATTRSRRLVAALEATADLVVLFDQHGIIRHANHAFNDFWRRTDATLLPLADIVGDANAAHWRALAGKPASEVGLKAPSGRLVQMSILVGGPIEDEADSVFTAAMRDITELVEAREQLEGLIQSKDEFIASVSHELRTPLTVVVGLSAELAADVSQFSIDEISEFASLIASQSGDVAALVEDLLTSARAEAGVLTVVSTRVNLSAQVKLTLELLSNDARSLVRVDEAQDVFVRADPVRVRQIVRNLLTNAQRYGGSRVSVSVTSEGGEGVVRVMDDGDPIPEEARARMFEPYERAHVRVGTPDSVGLGLTVSQRLAALMGGHIDYHHDGERSVFTLHLPLEASA